MQKALPLILISLFFLPSSFSPGTTYAQEPTQAQQTAQTAATALTNRDVLEMLKAGLTPEIVIAKIKSSICNFDTSPALLQELKTAGVPDSVILAMVQAPIGPPKPADSGTLPGASATPKPPEFIEVKTPDGTPIEIELRANVSSEAVEEGSIVDFTVVQPVKVNGLTVIERAASARGRIVEVKKARHWGRAGKIVWAMQDVLAADGNRIPARFTKETEGGGSSGKVAGAVVATAVLFWPAAPVWGLKKGKPAVLPAGQRFQVFVHGDSMVKAKAAREGEAQPAEPKQEPKPKLQN